MSSNSARRDAEVYVKYIKMLLSLDAFTILDLYCGNGELAGKVAEYVQKEDKVFVGVESDKELLTSLVTSTEIHDFPRGELNEEVPYLSFSGKPIILSPDHQNYFDVVTSHYNYNQNRDRFFKFASMNLKQDGLVLILDYDAREISFENFVTTNKNQRERDYIYEKGLEAGYGQGFKVKEIYSLGCHRLSSESSDELSVTISRNMTEQDVFDIGEREVYNEMPKVGLQECINDSRQHGFITLYQESFNDKQFMWLGTKN